jgi:hypothetical protein
MGVIGNPRLTTLDPVAKAAGSGSQSKPRGELSVDEGGPGLS